MNNKIDPCDTMRVNLIAAAVGLQQCTKTASNIVHIPGGDRVIAIGTPAQVRGLLAAEPTIVHVRDFGAIADGVADDAPALQRAVDAAELIGILKAIRPGYGDVGTRDVDVAAQQKCIDRAVALLEQGARLSLAEVEAAAICDGVAAKSRNHLFRSGAKICAGEIRAAQRCSVQGCTEPAGPNTVGACTTHLGEFKNWGLARDNADQVDSEGGHHD